MLIFSLILTLIAPYTIFAKGLATKNCIECQEHIRFAKQVQKQVNQIVSQSKWAEQLHGIKENPCGDKCTKFHNISPNDFFMLSKAYRESQDIQMNAWQEIKSRESAQERERCYENKCPKQRDKGSSF